MALVVEILKATDEFQRIETLRRNRHKRYQSRRFFVEGVRNIEQALSHGWQFESLVYSRDRNLSAWALDVISRAKAAVCYRLTQELMDQLSEKDEPSELVAEVRMPADSLERIVLGQRPLITLCDRPANKGNLGSIVRSCDAFGSQGVVVTGHAVDPYDPATIRASMGSFFSVPVVFVPSHETVLAWVEGLRRRWPDLQVVGSSARASVELSACDFTRPTLLLIGNEARGLTQVYKAASNILITIPMVGSASSLNAASAASVMLYEADRQRRRADRAL